MSRVNRAETSGEASFAGLLEECLTLGDHFPFDNIADDELRENLLFASRLHSLEFKQEQELTARLRARLFGTDEDIVVHEGSGKVEVEGDLTRENGRLPFLKPYVRRHAAAVIAGIVLLLLAMTVFCPPLSALAQRFIGIGYFPRVGFIPLEGASVLEETLTFNFNGREVKILQAVNSQHGLEIWVAYEGWEELPVFPSVTTGMSQTAIPMNGWWDYASITNGTGYWRYEAGLDVSHGVMVSLGEDMELLLALVPASELLQDRGTLAAFSSLGSQSCDIVQGVEICSLAIFSDSESTHILLSVRATDPMFDDWEPFIPIEVEGQKPGAILLNQHGEEIAAFSRTSLDQVYGRTLDDVYTLQVAFPAPVVTSGMSAIRIERMGLVSGNLDTDIVRIPIPERTQFMEGVNLTEVLHIAGIPFRISRAQLFPSYPNEWIVQLNLDQMAQDQQIQVTSFSIERGGNLEYETGVTVQGTTAFQIQLRMTDDALRRLEGEGEIQLRVQSARIEVIGPFVIREESQ